MAVKTHGYKYLTSGNATVPQKGAGQKENALFSITL